MQWIPVAPERALPPGSACGVETDLGFIAVFNAGGRFHAIDDLCPHVGERLSQGRLDGCIVTCPGHGWRFDVRTGRSPDFEGIRVPRFEVRVQDGTVFLVLAGDPEQEWEGASDPDDIEKALFD